MRCDPSFFINGILKAQYVGSVKLGDTFAME